MTMKTIYQKLLISILCLLVFMNASVSAMTFSQPEEIGIISAGLQSPYKGYSISGAVSNKGVETTKVWGTKERDWIDFDPVKHGHRYLKGIAIFGTNNYELYCNYDWEAYKVTFGGQNQAVASMDGFDAEIYKIENDKNLPMFCIYHTYKTSRFSIFGKMRDGKWVKYVDNTITDNYFRQTGGTKNIPLYNKIRCESDTIVVSYRKDHSSKADIGEFRFKWDNKAQWFGIEQVVY